MIIYHGSNVIALLPLCGIRAIREHEMMENTQFELVLQTISTGLVAMIITETGLDEDTAMEKLYSSALYSALENEETKVWHYSVSKLYELWENEIKTGRLTLPEY